MPLVLSNAIPPDTVIANLRHYAGLAGEVERVLDRGDAFLLRPAPDRVEYEPRRWEATLIEKDLASRFDLREVPSSCCLVRVLRR